MSPTNWHVARLFLESEVQHRGNKQMKNANSQPDLAVFLARTDSEYKII